MRDLIVVSILFVVIFGGLAWTRLMYWEWLKERNPRSRRRETT